MEKQIVEIRISAATKNPHLEKRVPHKIPKPVEKNTVTRGIKR
jgi:hypothetical protein